MLWWDGRINRVTYLILLGGTLVVYAISHALFRGSMVSQWIGFAIEIGTLRYLCVPRLHDMGKPGWWIVAILFAAITVLGGVAWAVAPQAKNVPLYLTALLILMLQILLGAIRGQTATNQYGETPPSGFWIAPKEL